MNKSRKYWQSPPCVPLSCRPSRIPATNIVTALNLYPALLPSFYSIVEPHGTLAPFFTEQFHRANHLRSFLFVESFEQPDALLNPREPNPSTTLQPTAPSKTQLNRSWGWSRLNLRFYFPREQASDSAYASVPGSTGRKPLPTSLSVSYSTPTYGSLVAALSGFLRSGLTRLRAPRGRYFLHCLRFLVWFIWTLDHLVTSTYAARKA
ncbi:hypothetical protein L2E82_53738 [Cichorium intybus]|nr:hypothetical protein L2E82_53738 [Cichorium intybus]